MKGQRLGASVRLYWLLLWRHRFIHVYAIVGASSFAVLRLVFDPATSQEILPALLVYEPGLLGLVLSGAYLFFERAAGTLAALRVSPLQGVEYAAALAFGSAVVSTCFAVLLHAAVVGPGAGRSFAVAAIVFLFSLASGAIGLALASAFDDLVNFLVAAVVPIVLASQAALLAYYEVVPSSYFAWVPAYSALRLLGVAMTSMAPDLWVALHLTALMACAFVSLWLGCRGVRQRIFRDAVSLHWTAEG